jgi:hypothetical protein
MTNAADLATAAEAAPPDAPGIRFADEGLTPLARLRDQREITMAQWAACERWRSEGGADFRNRSASDPERLRLRFVHSSPSTDDRMVWALDAVESHSRVREALGAENVRLLAACIVTEASWTTLGRVLRVTDKTAKRRVIDAIAALARFYEGHAPLQQVRRIGRRHPALPEVIAAYTDWLLAKSEASFPGRGAHAAIRRLRTDRRAVEAWRELLLRRRGAGIASRPFANPTTAPEGVMLTVDTAARYDQHARQAEAAAAEVEARGWKDVAARYREEAALWRAQAAATPPPPTRRRVELFQEEATRQLLYATVFVAVRPTVRVVTKREVQAMIASYEREVGPFPPGLLPRPGEPLIVRRARGDARVRGAIIFLAERCRELFGKQLLGVVASLVSVALEVNVPRSTVQRALTHTERNSE